MGLLVKSISLPFHANLESTQSQRQTTQKDVFTTQSQEATCIQYGSVEFWNSIDNHNRSNEDAMANSKNFFCENVSRTFPTSKSELTYGCVFICAINFTLQAFFVGVVLVWFLLLFVKSVIKQSAD